MEKVKIFILAGIVLFLASCTNKSEIERLQNENDSLKSVSRQSDTQLQDYIVGFNEIQENLNMIKEKEQIISTRTDNPEAELDEDTKNQINNDILAIYELMNKNKEKINSLQKKLNASGQKNSQLAKSIKLFEKQIIEKDQTISELKTELAELNMDITELNTKIDSLNTSMDELSQENTDQQEVIENQDDILNKAFYTYGTKKELKENDVISKDGLLKVKIDENFNRNYFTEIDIRDVKEIALNVKKVKLLSNHPTDSYRFVEKNDKIEKLEIIDYQKFWEASKFLVIMVN